MAARHYSASRYDYDQYDDEIGEFDGYEGDEDHHGDTAPSVQPAVPIPVVPAVPIKVAAKKPPKSPVISNKLDFPPLSAPPPLPTTTTTADTNNNSSDGKAEENDNDDGPLMMPTLNRSASSHIEPVGIDSDITTSIDQSSIFDAIAGDDDNDDIDDGDDVTNTDDDPVRGLSLADFIIKKVKRQQQSDATPTSAAKREGYTADDTVAMIAENQAAVEAEHKDEMMDSNEEVHAGGSSVEDKSRHVDSLQRFHEFGSFSLSGGSLIRTPLAESKYAHDVAGFTSANAIRVADTAREVWLSILQYLDPSSLARSSRVCGLWYHCICQHDRLWKRIYTASLPRLWSDTLITGSATLNADSLPPSMTLTTGSAYARAWIYSQAAFVADLLVRGSHSWSSVVQHYAAWLYTARGYARTRLHVPFVSTSGYLSNDGKLLATVQRNTHLLPPERPENFTTVALYRIDDLHTGSTLESKLATTASATPWRLIAHPPPSCVDVVISLELGYCVMRSEYLLSVYQLTGAQRRRPVEPLWSIEMNGRRAVPPKSMFISTYPAKRPALILCYPGGSTVARRLHNGLLISGDVFADPIMPIESKLPVNTNDDSLVPLAPTASAAPSKVAAIPVTPHTDELQPGAPPVAIATPVPTVVATAAPAERAIAAAPLLVAATAQVSPEELKLVPINRSVETDYKRLGPSSSSSSSAVAPAPASSLSSGNARAGVSSGKQSGSSVVAVKRVEGASGSSAVSSPAAAPTENKAARSDVVVAGDITTILASKRVAAAARIVPVKKVEKLPKPKDEDRRDSKQKKREIRRLDAAHRRQARIEAARLLTRDDMEEKELQRQLARQRAIPTSFHLSGRVLVRAIHHQLQILDMSQGRPSKVWSPDPVKRQVSWVRAWDNGVVSCHMVANAYAGGPPHNVFLYARTLDGQRTTLSGLPDLYQWTILVDAYIHPTLGYFILLFPQQIYVWDLSRHQSRPFAVIGPAFNDHGSIHDYTSVCCDKDRLITSTRESRSTTAGSYGGSVLMWRWLSMRRGPTKLVAGRYRDASNWCTLAANGTFASHMTGESWTHRYSRRETYWHYVTSEQQASYIWVGHLFAQPARMLTRTLTFVNGSLSLWWDELVSRIESRVERARAAAAKEAARRKKEEMQRSAESRKHGGRVRHHNNNNNNDEEDEGDDSDDDEVIAAR